MNVRKINLNEKFMFRKNFHEHSLLDEMCCHWLTQKSFLCKTSVLLGYGKFTFVCLIGSIVLRQHLLVHICIKHNDIFCFLTCIITSCLYSHQVKICTQFTFKNIKWSIIVFSWRTFSTQNHRQLKLILWDI